MLMYFLVILGSVMCLIASAHVKSTYRKYARVASSCGMTGAQVAQRILRDNDIMDVSVQHVNGELTDHYNPTKKVVNLSDAVYGESSVAAISVAAHECGHVIQHHKGYLPMIVRSWILPLANFGSKIGIPMVIIGLALGGAYRYYSQSAGTYAYIGSLICTIGVWVFAFAVLFQIVTLPVEINASGRAMRILESTGMLQGEEVKMGSKVLKAAALTYVAAAASSILQLLRLLLITRGRRK